jgi:uncharacterized membrane protein YhaH (DUF805 family)
MKQLFFSFQGRINRAQFWLASALIGVLDGIVFGGTSVYSTAAQEPDTAVLIALMVLIVVILVATIYAAVCIGIKRFHDRGKPGVWVLVQFVPMIGAFWYFIEAGCLRGTPGPNLYGPDPLAPDTQAATAY